HYAAGRILESRSKVDEARSRALDAVANIGGAYAIGAGREGSDSRIGGTERVQRAEIGGVLHEDGVAALQVERGAERDRGLGAVGNQDFVFLGGETGLRVHRGDGLT